MEYQKYEFCKAVKCAGLKPTEDAFKCSRNGAENCIYTAKEFHKWLQENGFVILRKETPIRKLKENKGK